MSKSPRPKKGLVDGSAKDGSKAAASALHAKTRLVKFTDFQSDSFLADQTETSRAKDDPDSSDGSAR